MFKNRYTTTHRSRVDANRVQARAGTTPAASVGPTLSAHDSDKLGKLMQRTWMSMIGEESPREIFLEQNAQIVEEKKAEIEAEPGNKAFAAGLQNAAESRAWHECDDKERYEELARVPVSRETCVRFPLPGTTITDESGRAREFFSPLMQQAVKSVAQRKVIGDMAFKALVGWRKSDGSVHVELYARSQRLPLTYSSPL